MARSIEDDASGRPGDAAKPEGLSFPDLPRLELERLLGQLTDRTQDVLSAQGRLRGLLRANAAIVDDLSLPVVLRHIVSAAQELVGARYAALGVIGRGGLLEEFVHVGMDAGTVQRIGGLPQGRGLLGHLIAHPAPVRLAELGGHPAAAGFPAQHPEMGSFLGVPVRVRDEVFGNLYLTDSVHGEFSEEDEQLAGALAGTAGVAIANARLYQQAERQRQWLAASTELTQQLFAGETDRPLDLVLRYALAGADADLAILTMPLNAEQARVEACAGALAEPLTGQPVPMGQTVAGLVIRSGKPVLITEEVTGFGEPGGMNDLPDSVGEAVGVPLLAAGDRVLGALILGRADGRDPFTDTDMALLAGFAGHAGVALQLDRARADHETLLLIADHDRIAADLHDHVVQELFATGIGLQGMIGALPDPRQQARVSGYIDALDATIRRIRTTIFQLHPAPQNPAGLRQRLLLILEEETPALGFHAQIDFRGPLDTGVPPGLADDLVAVLREALSNTARHAQASSAQVTVALLDALVTLEVTDDGRGIGATTRSSGLANMRRRAQAHTGALELNTPAGGGTHLHWTARIA